MIELNTELAVIGGGLSGTIAAIAAARNGIKVILINDRSMLGGNASSEFRMHICGADYHMSRPNARETGILEEIELENKRRNPDFSYPIWDEIIREKVEKEENITLLLNTYMYSVEHSENRVTSCACIQSTSEKTFKINANFFIDATGDGSLSEKSGAEYKIGREAKNEYGESLAPDKADSVTMGSSIMFQAEELDHPVKFIKPDWAYSYSEKDMANRDHSSIKSGYWWIELGGDKERIIEDAEEIHRELRKVLYGVWDHIKNHGDHGAENYKLSWVSPIAGKRESRRVIGDYVLKEDDINNCRIFEDAVSYGGWPMDIHTAGGFLKHDDVPTVWNHVEDIYTIPYRCYYSKNIDNLFIAGRIISASHVAFSSSRVMGTCAVGAEAVGNAASIAIKKGLKNAREVGKHIKELQQKLLKDDCFIPGFKNEDESDKARRATITCTRGENPADVINGCARSIKDNVNAWTANIKEIPSLNLSFAKKEEIREIRLTFDSNLSQEITPSIIEEVLARAERQSPSTLVDEFSIEIKDGEKSLLKQKQSTNGQRHIVIKLDDPLFADSITLTLLSSFGEEKVKVFEIRVY